MSCADVMYQPYTPYFPYQRPHMAPTATATVTATSATSPPDLIPIAPYDVKAYTSGFQNWRGLSHMNSSTNSLHLPEGLFPLENLKHKFGVPKMPEPMEQGSPDFVMGNGMLNSPMNLASTTGNGSNGRSTSSVSSSSRAANSSTASAASSSAGSSSVNGDLTGNDRNASTIALGDNRSLTSSNNAAGVRVNSAAADVNGGGGRVSSTSTAATSRVNNLNGGKASCVAAAATASSSTVAADAVKSEVMHATDAQYISANCVLFTYYSGDISTVVDEHFSRALSCANQSKGFVSKENSPMSQRNFPPSFWNSHYVYQGSPSMSLASLGAAGHGHIHSHGHSHAHAHPELTYSAATDAYHHATSTLHGIHQTDPWHYPGLTSQSPYTHPAHRPMHHDLAAYNGMTGQSGFSPQYGSLLLQPPSVRSSRLGPGQCSSLGKSSESHWSAAQRYHEHLTSSDISSHLEAANYGGGHGYTSMCSMPGEILIH
ncbi:hypothetical protein CHUAL_007664 [Chamberlinius hualienensis]